MAGRGTKCAIYGCTNYNIQKNSRSFFRFPKNKQLCLQWLSKSKRPDLDQILQTRGPEYMYKTHTACSDHFERSCFRNPNLFSQGLLPGSVPTLMLPNQDQTTEPIQNNDKKERLSSELEVLNNGLEAKTPNNGSETEVPTYYLEIEMPDDCSVTEISNNCSGNEYFNVEPVATTTHGASLEEKYENLKRKYRNQQKLLSKYKIAFRKLRIKNKLATKNNLTVVSSKSVSRNFFNFQQKQSSLKPNGRRYSLEDKNFAIALYYCSSSTYEYLQKHFSLPSVKSIRNWLQNVSVSPNVYCVS